MRTEHSPGEILRYEAKTKLGNTENVDNALRWIKNNPEGFAKRIDEFDDVLDGFNDIIKSDSIDINFFGGARRLKENFQIDGLPNIKELIGTESTGSPIPYSEIESTYKNIDTLIKEKKWEFPTSITNNPNRLTSGLLIEGYGLLIENHYDKKGLARDFVLSFEEVMLINQGESAILNDVIEWMKEEVEDFSPGIQGLLNKNE